MKPVHFQVISKALVHNKSLFTRQTDPDDSISSPGGHLHDEREFTSYLVIFRPFQSINLLIIPMQGENMKDHEYKRQSSA